MNDTNELETGPTFVRSTKLHSYENAVVFQEKKSMSFLALRFIFVFVTPKQASSKKRKNLAEVVNS